MLFFVVIFSSHLSLVAGTAHHPGTPTERKNGTHPECRYLGRRGTAYPPPSYSDNALIVFVRAGKLWVRRMDLPMAPHTKARRNKKVAFPAFCI